MTRVRVCLCMRVRGWGEARRRGGGGAYLGGGGQRQCNDAQHTSGVLAHVVTARATPQARVLRAHRRVLHHAVTVHPPHLRRLEAGGAGVRLLRDAAAHAAVAREVGSAGPDRLPAALAARAATVQGRRRERVGESAVVDPRRLHGGTERRGSLHSVRSGLGFVGLEPSQQRCVRFFRGCGGLGKLAGLLLLSPKLSGSGFQLSLGFGTADTQVFLVLLRAWVVARWYQRG